MNTIDSLMTNLLGAAPVNYITDATGNVSVVYDTWFILKAIILVITLKTVFDLMLIIPKIVARRITKND
ncbi:hypothetical protein CLHUN_35850 [Ruminiclostridium hungatei]|uniref:Uncharacterized protein n=1 Tax=Ruminiclostridium hungatei TaxID=48256 RepID=A0A1V4SEX7_RUMHU|nr:hypothetical protein [Ruminiclostridium hungatei]OPX42449.1 hypothetical protein CLHUN_35740 [Ruminiclostridium hungatei]OPX42460.1 hypothetical protein CLHUN_35850 [Ruminiclostridium hungatei]